MQSLVYYIMKNRYSHKVIAKSRYDCRLRLAYLTVLCVNFVLSSMNGSCCKCFICVIKKKMKSLCKLWCFETMQRVCLVGLLAGHRLSWDTLIHLCLTLIRAMDQSLNPGGFHCTTCVSYNSWCFFSRNITHLGCKSDQIQATQLGVCCCIMWYPSPPLLERLLLFHLPRM